MRTDKLDLDEGLDLRSQLYMPGGLELHIGVSSQSLLALS